MGVQHQPRVTVELQGDRSLVIRWKNLMNDTDARVKFEYYDPAGPMVNPRARASEPCSGSAMHLSEPVGPEACTLRVFLEIDGKVVAQTQTTWDHQFPSKEKCNSDLHARAEILYEQLRSQDQAPRSKRILVVGAQHHGKSSFINHVYRCLMKDVDANDQMESAPAGVAENTQAILECKVAGLSFLDTPAIPNMSSEMAKAFEALLKRKVADGTRRAGMEQRQSWFFDGYPPAAAIVVMSLCHWRDQPDEMQRYLAEMSNKLKHASDGRVVFPFVVAATHRDEFLRDCTAENPYEDLKKVVESMKKAANCSHVFAFASYQRASRGSKFMNEQTFQLLSQLLTYAAHQDTGAHPVPHAIGIAAACQGPPALRIGLCSNGIARIAVELQVAVQQSCRGSAMELQSVPDQDPRPTRVFKMQTGIVCNSRPESQVTFVSEVALTHHVLQRWMLSCRVLLSSQPARSQAALKGVAKQLPCWTGADVGDVRLFQFSENAALDLQTLKHELGQCGAVEVWVVVLTTGSSSYLWFDQEHHPHNVELCRCLRDDLQLELNFAVCPTSEKAKDDWPDAGTLQLTDRHQKVFHQFWPAGQGSVKVWHGFSSQETLPKASIVSLIYNPGVPAVAPTYPSKRTLSCRAVFTVAAVCLNLVLAGCLYGLHEREVLTRESLERLSKNLQEERTESIRLITELEKETAAHNQAAANLKTEQAKTQRLSQELDASQSRGDRLSKQLAEVKAEKGELGKQVELLTAASKRDADAKIEADGRVLQHETQMKQLSEQLDKEKADNARLAKELDSETSARKRTQQQLQLQTDSCREVARKLKESQSENARLAKKLAAAQGLWQEYQPRSKAALAGVARALPDWTGADLADVRLFQFSESADLDLRKLNRVLAQSDGLVIWVVLLVTGEASYLWFDPSHHPRNVELCRFLLNELQLELNFVVCPTDATAKAFWPVGPLQPTDFLREVFRSFWPRELNRVKVWLKFDSNETLAEADVVTLSRNACVSSVTPDHSEKGNRKVVGFLAVCLGFALAGLLVLVWLLNIESNKNAKLAGQLEEEMFARENAQKEVQKLQASEHHLAMQLQGQTSEGQRLAAKLAACEAVENSTASHWLVDKFFGLFRQRFQSYRLSDDCCKGDSLKRKKDLDVCGRRRISAEFGPEVPRRCPVQLRFAAMAAKHQPSVAVELREDRSLVITWKDVQPDAMVKLEYYDPATPMLEPEHTSTHRCSGPGLHLEPVRPEACTLKVALEIDAEVVAKTQTTWDHQFPDMMDCVLDLEKRAEKLSKQIRDAREFLRSTRILVVGGQHHGKSSFINHMYRCLTKDLDANDQMESAPAGAAENTQAILECKVAELSFLDTPAFANMGTDMARVFESVLKRQVADGTRRAGMEQRQSWFFDGFPPAAAIVVMSLCHWRDQPDEMQRYLAEMSNKLKHASDGQVVFPFVVAATHRDEFLRDCKAEKPHEELKAVLQNMRKSSNCNHVFAIANYQAGSKGSAVMNEQTFKLLSQLFVHAAYQDTGKAVAAQNDAAVFQLLGSIIVAFIVFLLALAIKGAK
ncbi:unnamed protein product [Symbiodinium sp. CCMP2456]|nr:unnamed protein product [Symbiodinium sp. CCMP2456]